MAFKRTTAQGLARRLIKPGRNGRPQLSQLGVLAAESAVRSLLTFLGEDPHRDGLAGTPARVVKALFEMTCGYGADIPALFKAQFAGPTDEIIAVKGIRFSSLCEHHLLPFTGTAAVAYLPGPKVLGLSKLARVVNAFARRFQIQERLTTQIAEAIMQHGQAQAAAVILKARHSCMGCRGAGQPEAEMVTSALLGPFRTDAAARLEVLTLLK